MTAPTAIPGRALDPALGLPRAIFRVRRWPQWLQAALGAGMVVLGFALVLPTGWRMWGLPFDAAVPIIGSFVMLEALRRLRGSACLIVAADGFEDRVDDTLTVLWRDVRGMAATRREPGKIVELTVKIARPDGKTRDHVLKVSEIFGNADPVLAALDDSWQRWQERTRRA